MGKSLDDYRRAFYGTTAEEYAQLKEAYTNGLTLTDLINGGGDGLVEDDIGDTVQAWAQVLDDTTAAFLIAHKTKIDHLTITQAVDLDAIETRVNSLDTAVILRGVWDASAGTFPGSGTAQAGDSYIVSVAGTVNSVVFAIGDRIIAITDNASTTTYANNWFKADYTDLVSSVDGLTGAVSLSAVYQPLHADLTDLVARWVKASASGPSSLDLAEDTDNGLHIVRVIAPAAIASDKTLTLPDETGTFETTAGAQARVDIHAADSSDVHGITDSDGYILLAALEDGSITNAKMAWPWISAYATADTAAVNASTTLVNDSELLLTVESNAVYVVQGLIFYDASTTADYKCEFILPSGTFKYVGIAGGSGATTSTTSPNIAQRSAGTPVTFGGVGAGTIIGSPISGLLIVGVSGGTFRHQYAQVNSDASDLFRRAGSWLAARRIA